MSTGSSAHPIASLHRQRILAVYDSRHALRFISLRAAVSMQERTPASGMVDLPSKSSHGESRVSSSASRSSLAPVWLEAAMRARAGFSTLAGCFGPMPTPQWWIIGLMPRISTSNNMGRSCVKWNLALPRRAQPSLTQP